MGNDLIIRKTSDSDFRVLRDIYNQAIDAKYCICDTIPISTHERIEWFKYHQNERFPIFVCEKNGIVIGYATISPYHGGREAVQNVGEVSFYIDFSFHQQGIGSKLLEFIIDEAKQIGYEYLLAIILECNTGSISLLKKYGFSQWGLFPEIIQLQDNHYSHLYYGMKLANR